MRRAAMPRLMKSSRLASIVMLALATACVKSGTPDVSPFMSRLRSPAGLPLPSTRAERTAYTETSSYADVIGFVDSLRLMGAPLTVLPLAQSPEGRIVPMVIASRPRVRTPDEARRLDRPIVYVQANIHAGEVEGKEAMLALLRDWSVSSVPNVLDSLVIIVIPIYNADGNEKLAEQARNRGSQNGPAMIGERANGLGLDLNRDYVKAEAPETRGTLAAFNAWDPDVFMDLHTTNGSYHGYALTYSPSLHPASPLSPYTADTLLPEIRRRMRLRHGFEVFPYGNFTAVNGRESITATEQGVWQTYEHKQRFGTNYYGLRGRVSILSEAFSHDPFARRVASTRAFVQETLSLVAVRHREIAARVAEGVAASTFNTATTPAVPIRSRFSTRPDTQEVLVEVLERLADSTLITESGAPRGIRRTGHFESRRMPVIDRFESRMARTPPLGYLLDAKWTAVADLLRAHGVTVMTLARAQSVSVQIFTVDSLEKSPRPFQGHREASITGTWGTATRNLPAGTLLIPMGTPRDLLAMQLLEPEGDDGLLTWNLFDSALQVGKEVPVARLAAPLR